MNHLVPIALVCVAYAVSAAQAGEPNDAFASATILAPSQAHDVITDAISPGVVSGAPDTLLGIRNALGDIVQTDDDGSFLGNGVASGLREVAIDDDSIRLAVTGFGDDNFTGAHIQQGAFLLDIDVFDAGGGLTDSFDAESTLAGGIVAEFLYSNVTWVGGSFDVNLDNVLRTGGDVDFFRFIGLSPGGEYVAETLDFESSGIDTMLAWFDEEGALVAMDDDGAGGKLSQLKVAATTGGTVTLAVTGFGDDHFQGRHAEDGLYSLRLAPAGGFLMADFDENNLVNAADLNIWSAGFGIAASATHAQGDADGDLDVDGADLIVWQRQLGADGSAALAVPEPPTALLFALVCGAVMLAASPYSRRREK